MLPKPRIPLSCASQDMRLGLAQKDQPFTVPLIRLAQFLRQAGLLPKLLSRLVTQLHKVCTSLTKKAVRYYCVWARLVTHPTLNRRRRKYPVAHVRQCIPTRPTRKHCRSWHNRLFTPPPTLL